MKNLNTMSGKLLHKRKDLNNTSTSNKKIDHFIKCQVRLIIIKPLKSKNSYKDSPRKND